MVNAHVLPTLHRGSRNAAFKLSISCFCALLSSTHSVRPAMARRSSNWSFDIFGGTAPNMSSSGGDVDTDVDAGGADVDADAGGDVDGRGDGWGTVCTIEDRECPLRGGDAAGDGWGGGGWGGWGDGGMLVRIGVVAVGMVAGGNVGVGGWDVGVRGEDDNGDPGGDGGG